MAVRFVESVLLSVFMAVVAYGLGRLVGVVFKSVMEHNADLDAIRAVIARRAKLERGLDTRIRSRRSVMAKLDRDIKELVRQSSIFDHATAIAMQITDHLTRLIGEEVAGRQRFLALVYNRTVSPGGGGKTTIDAAWATAQEVEIWTTSVADARSEVEKRYPPSFGYVVSSLVAAGLGVTPDTPDSTGA
ncbi:MAG: hypothetical protein WCK65_03500 [Rhodospirillaceae bacterium]